jgi:hypothetical protein
MSYRRQAIVMTLGACVCAVLMAAASDPGFRSNLLLAALLCIIAALVDMLAAALTGEDR